MIDRIPPAATTTPTMRATPTAPTHRGSPVVMPTVSAAPCSCGTMYSHPMRMTSTDVTLRTPRDSRRASVKSGTVYAPERRSGAATNSSSMR